MKRHAKTPAQCYAQHNVTPPPKVTPPPNVTPLPKLNVTPSLALRPRTLHLARLQFWPGYTYLYFLLMLLRKTIRRRRLRRFHFIPFLLLFAEILDRAPYRKNACVFESGSLEYPELARIPAGRGGVPRTPPSITTT